ncbi:MAG TPA: type VI secretion system ImpA family N-terminal domain-containing protein, partial [Pseudomonadales bacterium]|nr:type VI secretion system ImpA family N-terminal domain-containing protein [Pseudomonadales bacterium]
MDIESLLSPISEQSPSGPDLEYDQEFLALDQAARGKPEQQFGDTIVPAEEPAWTDVRKRAEALFSRTKDLRVAIPLVRAWARQENFVGLAAGLNLVNELLTRFWDSLHPMLDVDDGNDPTMRMNALSGLSDEDFIRDMRNLMVVSPSRFGKVSVKDILIAQNKFPAGTEGAPSPAEVEGIIRSSAEENAEQLNAIRAAFTAAQTIYKTVQ